MKSRDIAIVGILLAIGAILRYLSNIVPGAIVANPIIALYCLAIILIMPRLKDVISIGIVAGIISALISHSILPPANLISEPLGAVVCMAAYTILRNKIPLSAGIATFISTLVSGFTFLAICLVVILAGVIPEPMETFTIGAYVLLLSPIIILTAFANSIITQILFIPSSKILMRGSGRKSGEADADAEQEETEAENAVENAAENTDAATGAEAAAEKDAAEEVSDVSAIKFENFSYTYPSGSHPALTGIDLDIKKGECILVNGTTGAGKTTFCLAAAGILTHEYEGSSEGTISIFGKDVRDYQNMGDIGKKIGVVFDDADAQLIFTTVEEEVLSGLENRGLSSADVKERLEKILKLTDIEKIRYRPPHTLSGGQKQRVALAATLASGTDCIILDEATAELDTHATGVIISILKELKAQKKTIIVVEQKPREMAEITDRVVMIEKGEITGIVSSKEFFENYHDDEDIADLKTGDSDSSESEGSGTQDAEYDRKETAIKITDLVHQYGENRGIDGLSVEIKHGELVAVIGENGSGKTTLSKHLNGLLKPTSGDVIVAGMNTKEATVTELANHAGLVFQNPDTMLFEETVEKEILFGLKNIGKKEEECDGIIDGILAEVGLSDKRKVFPRSMSRGERQRLAIACVTAMRPEIIILDEPTTGLDPIEARRIMSILTKLSRQGHTVLMVSHDMNIVRNYAERIIKMADGKIVEDIRVKVN
ncbi:MAG: ATP-binding cassette domain-containing protein [Methanomicrobium sp.]|nr:ATP-binding cassette domain-containing protein [Methanomicrobium sp.]